MQNDTMKNSIGKLKWNTNIISTIQKKEKQKE